MARPKINDLPVLMDMAENWVSNSCTASTRELAHQFKSKIILANAERWNNLNIEKLCRKEKTDYLREQESASKRVQGKFGEWKKDDTALAVGIFEEQRVISYMIRFNSDVDNSNLIAVKKLALSQISKMLKMPIDKVEHLYEVGRKFLEQLHPDDPKFRRNS
jgi:hypothetical protein